MDTGIHQWHKPPSHIALRADEVHIWRASLELSADMLTSLQSSLSDDERARADRFYFEKDRLQFTAAHGILRDILGRYCSVAPAEICFSTGSQGKPAMEGTPAGERVEFNMSHSRWMAMYAVALQQAVGVDIEYIREDFECERIAERFFDESETAHLRGLPEQERLEAFFGFWTYKEAYIKGRGKGLSIPTRSFAVRIIDEGRASIEHRGMDAANGATPAGPTLIEHAGSNAPAGHIPEGPAPGARNGTNTGQAGHWSLFALDPAPGYAGAVAIEGDDALPVLWEW